MYVYILLCALYTRKQASRNQQANTCQTTHVETKNHAAFPAKNTWTERKRGERMGAETPSGTDIDRRPPIESRLASPRLASSATALDLEPRLEREELLAGEVALGPEIPDRLPDMSRHLVRALLLRIATRPSKKKGGG